MFNPQLYVKDFIHVLRLVDLDTVGQVADVLHQAYVTGRTVFCFGNGGSAANASHFAADVTKLTAPHRGARRLRAVALNESTSAISAIANDFSFDEIFEEQLRAFLQPGDVLVGFSTSGSSPNVLRAMEYGRRNGAITIGVTGRFGSDLRDRVHHAVMVPSASVQQVEDATMVVAHLLCLMVQARCAAAEEREVLQPLAQTLNRRSLM